MASRRPTGSRQGLAQLRREHELILNSAGEGIYQIDTNGNFIFINPKGAELFGCNAAELIGKPAHPTVHYSHADGRQYQIDECPIYASMRDGAPRRVTNDIFWRRDGSSFRVNYVAAPIKTQRGQIKGTIVTFRDVTEQIIADARLKLQAEQYRLLFETNPSPMWVFDTKTLRILAVNQAAIAQYGYSREEFLSLNITDLRPPKDVSALIAALKKQANTAQLSGEVGHVRRDGSRIPVQIYSAPIVWEGHAARIVTAIDVTQRKEIEEVLRTSQAQLLAVLETLAEGVITSDLEGNLLDWNSAALRAHGIADQHQPANLTALVHAFALSEMDGNRVPVEQWPLARILRGEILRDLKLRLTNIEAGWERIFSYGGTLVRDNRGKPFMAVMTIRNMT